MRKSFISLMAIATALFVSSCAKEVAPSVSEGNDATVTFSIALEDVAATRAIGDGTGCDVLVYEVYDAEGTKIDALSATKSPAFQTGLEETVEITLAKGQTYSFAFWAQNSECTAYTTTDLQRVEISYEGAANDETRDAFFANTDDITVTGNFSQDVTLKRPFAQINLAVSDLEAAEAAGIELDQVSVAVSEAAANFDAKTGEVSGAVTVEYSLADVLNQELALTNGEKYPWVAMNYLLVNNATASSLADVTFTLTTDKADIVLASSNTPLQRNWRTNIIAKLTSVGTFNIVIDPIFDADRDIFVDEENKEDAVEKVYGVKDEEGNAYETLAEAITAGAEEIKLADGEYTLDKAVADGTTIVGASKDVVVNAEKSIGMNGASATFENVTIATSGADYTGLQHSGAVTFNDCVIENTYWCYSGEAKTVFNNCTFKQTAPGSYNVWTYGSNVEFNNCVFECAGKSVLIYTEGGDVWETVSFKDCQFTASAPANDGKAAIEIDSSLNPANVIIENCTATGFDLGSVSGNMLYNLKKGEEGVNCNITVAVSEGVDIVKGVYEISNAAGMFWFANEVNANGVSFSGKTVKLVADIDLDNQLWAPVGQTGQPAFFKGTFDGNNKTIKNLKVDERSDNASYHGSGLFGWFEGNGPVVKNLTIDGAEVYGHHYVGAIIAYCEEGGIIEGCTVKNAKISCVFNTVKNDDGDKAGAVVGYLRGNVTNCHAIDCAVDAGRDAGQVVGAGLEANVTGCTATNVTVAANGTGDGSNIREAIVGRAL